VVLGWSGTFFQGFAVPDEAFAGVVRHLEILREFQGVGGARVFAQATKHAAAQVVGEVRQFFAASDRIAFAAYDDQLFWTSQRTEVARDAECLAIFGIDVEARCAAITFCNFGTGQRVLLGDDFLRALVLEGDPQSLDQVDQEQLACCTLESSHHPHRWGEFITAWAQTKLPGPFDPGSGLCWLVTCENDSKGLRRAIRVRAMQAAEAALQLRGDDLHRRQMQEQRRPELVRRQRCRRQQHCQ
jgi:hypothetical protein